MYTGIAHCYVLTILLFFYATPTEYIAHIGMVLIFFEEAVVDLKLNGSAFYTNRINYSGHLITIGGFKVSHYVSDVVQELQMPTTVNKVRSCLQLCSIYK